jgi:hypothetical protein
MSRRRPQGRHSPDSRKRHSNLCPQAPTQAKCGRPRLEQRGISPARAGADRPETPTPPLADVSDPPRRSQSIVRGSVSASASYTRHRRRDRRPYGRDLRRSDAQDLHRPARTATATSARLLISFRKPGEVRATRGLRVRCSTRPEEARLHPRLICLRLVHWWRAVRRAPPSFPVSTKWTKKA